MDAPLLGSAAALCAFLFLVAAPAVPSLHAAAPAPAQDTDGDGLSDLLELELRTLVDQADTDGDGYGDAEELARQSDPTDSASVPGAAPVQLGMAVHLEGQALRPVAAIYLADGSTNGKVFAMGMLARGSLVYLPLSFFNIRRASTLAPGGSVERVIVLEASIPLDHLWRTGSLSIFATLSHNGAVIAADAINLVDRGGVVVQHILSPVGRHGEQPVFGQNYGGVYRPLGGDPPGGWIPGEICAQTLAVAGVSGPVLTQEVIAADCMPGYDSYCDPGCSSTLGNTVRVVDPGLLIGG